MSLSEQSGRPLHSAFEAVKEPVSRASHVPGALYTSPEIYALEKERIFMKDWLCVGRAEELPNPGDYRAFRVLGEPVLLVRGAAGELSAFANICQHRGVEVAFGSGNAKSFSCPFHGWTYDLAGRLLGAPHMRDTDAFDKRNCRLPQLKVGDWLGWIFLTFDPDPRPLAEHTAQMDADFGFLRPQDCRLAIKTVAEAECNWKLVVENLIDFYHLKVVHTTTNGRLFTKDAFQFEPRSGGGYRAFFNSGPSTLSGEPVFGRMPWLEDKPQNFSITGLLPPNFTLFARVDTVHPTITWPLSPTRTQVIVYTLLPKIYFDEPDFDRRVVAYQDYQKRVFSEDRAMLESVQNGLASRNFRPGRMAEIEKGVHQVINGYLNRMGPEIERTLSATAGA